MLNVNWLASATELLFVFSTILIIFLYFQYRQQYSYWTKLGVQQLNPVFPVGDLSTAGIGITSVFSRIQILYNQFKQKSLEYGGIYFFNGPIFLPLSPDIIKRILVTDFVHFMDRGVYIDEENLPISAHLFSMKGQRWRDLRAKLTPTFTSGKMKAVYKILNQNVANFIEILKESSELDVDMKKALSRLTVDIIGNIAFGINCNSLKYPNDKFPQMADKIFNASTWEFLKLIIQEGLSNPGNVLKLIHNNDEISKYFTDLVCDTVAYRDKNQIKRDDFMDLILKLRDTTGLIMNDIIAQCYLFFIAGYETSASTMSYAIHELAYNQQIQKQVRDEIVENLGRDPTNFPYETLLKLPLLDKTVKETLRKYPVAPLLHRIVVKSYKIPESQITLETGTPVIIPVIGLHRDPEYFPEPLNFDPERFNSDNLHKIVPFAYLPFGDGPRNCIGMRLGILQVKAGLAALLSNFQFTPGKDSQRELTLLPSTTAPVLVVKNGVPVKITKI